MVTRYHGYTLPWLHVTMVTRYHGYTLPWLHVTMVTRYHGYTLPWLHVTMVTRYHGYTLPWLHVTMVTLTLSNYYETHSSIHAMGAPKLKKYTLVLQRPIIVLFRYFYKLLFCSFGFLVDLWPRFLTQIFFQLSNFTNYNLTLRLFLPK